MSISDSILKIGVVTAVRGRRIEITVDKTKNASNLVFNGDLIKNVSVGSYVKISKGFQELIGKIEGEFIVENRLDSDREYTHNNERIKRLLEVSLVGFIQHNKFEQGINELPLIDNECYLLTKSEFGIIHRFVVDTKNDDFINIGSLLNENEIPIELGVNDLFASHIGIFGNTGSGKSYTLAKVYYELFKKYKDRENFRKNTKFILFDFNGEYVAPAGSSYDNVIVEEKFKETYKLSTNRVSKERTNKFPISRKVVDDVSFWSILLKATEQTQKPFLEATFKKEFLLKNVTSEDGIKLIIRNTLKLLLTQITATQDKNFHIFFLEELLKFDGDKIFPNVKDLIVDYSKNLGFWADRNDRNFNYEEEGQSKIYSNKDLNNFIEKVINEKVNKLIIHCSQINHFQRIRLQIIFNYFYCIQKGYYNREHISPLIGRLEAKIIQADKVFTVEENQKKSEKFLIIISLKDVNVEMRKIIPLVISKEFYDYKKEATEPEQYLNIIIDEAHNILSNVSIRESETWKDYRLETFEEIIKEGRKFGVFLTLASQRPYDISTTIISQLHNYFLHRLINNKDIDAIERTVSYLDKVSFESISILPQGTCVFAGLSATLPVTVKIGEIKDHEVKDGIVRYRPFNETMSLTKNWN